MYSNMVYDMKTVKAITLNGQTVKYIHDLNNNQLWPYNGPGPQPPTNDQFYIKNLSSNVNTVTVKHYNTNTRVVSDSTINLSISQDNINWINIGTSSFTIQPNQIMYVKSLSAVPWAIVYEYNCFTTTEDFSIGGDIMTLLNYNNLQGYDCYNMFGSLYANYSLIDSNLVRFENDFKLPATTLANYCYAAMFWSCLKLTNIPNLPATTLATWCYQSMFTGCTSLTTLPANLLPATTLIDGCYNDMFTGCTGLTSIPVNFLPAMTLARYCYNGMFHGCTSLTTLPANLLPATTLVDGCYKSMFQTCRGLTTAPDLPAITLVYDCYSNMFNHCTNLKYIKAMFTTNISNNSNYTFAWLQNTSATGTFVKNVNATWIRSDASGTNGWTIQTVNP